MSLNFDTFKTRLFLSVPLRNSCSFTQGKCVQGDCIKGADAGVYLAKLFISWSTEKRLTKQHISNKFSLLLFFI